MRPDQDVMNRIKEAFEILKTPYKRTSTIVARGSRCGPNPWQQHHHKARDALRSAAKGERTFTSIWDRWQHDEIFRTSQLSHYWLDAWVRYLDHIVHFDISHNAPSSKRDRCGNLLHSRNLDENTAGRTVYGKDQGTRKRKRNWQIHTSQKTGTTS